MEDTIYNCISYKGFVSKIHTGLVQLCNQKTSQLNLGKGDEQKFLFNQERYTNS